MATPYMSMTQVERDALTDAMQQQQLLLESLNVKRLADVEPELVSWLWPGRLPRGKLVLLDGDPSIGKSTLGMDLAGRVSAGKEMPDGCVLDAAGDVVILSAEDGAADTIRPRLDAAGGDPERVHLLIDVLEHDDEGRARRRAPLLPVDIDRIEALVRKTRADLALVDVLAAYLGKTDSYRDSEVRGVLHPLAQMAERTGCVVLCLRHLTKNGGTNPLHRGQGSIAFTGAARVVLLAGADPEDDSRRILAVSKNNLAPIGDALAFRLVNAPEHGCARVAWEGTTTHRAVDLLSVRDDDIDTRDAADVLREVLADGPLRVKDALEKMAEAGFSKDQAKRAKSKAGVRSVKFGKPGDADSGWQWKLPPRKRAVPEESEGEGGARIHPSLPSLLGEAT